MLHSTEFGTIGNAFAAHASATLVTSAAMSGSPVAAPLASLHCTSSSTVCSSSAPVPTSAKSSWQALMIALRASLALSLESMKSTWTLRPAMPPLAFTYLAQPFTPSTMPWSTPGTIELSTSATTATLMVVAVIPTSLAVGFELDCAPAGAPASMAVASTMATTIPTLNDLDTVFPLLVRASRGGSWHVW